MKTAIIEDEIHSREFLKNLLAELHPDLNICGTASDVEEAIQLVNNQKPDIIFLDIEMQTGTGFDVLKRIEKYPCNVIFTTAYDHYAIKAIKFSAVDYLLKPIDLDELSAAVQRIKHKSNHTANNSVVDMLLSNLKKIKSDNPSITLATSEGLEFVPVNTIIRLEAAGAYTTFFLTDKRKIMVSKNLKEYEQLLEDSGFLRVHNSHVINLKQVKKYVKADGGFIVMNDNSNVLLSSKKREDFLKLMSEAGA
jgi:two-component system LytT family response regulator